MNQWKHMIITYIIYCLGDMFEILNLQPFDIEIFPVKLTI
jgi:hypothetical protein